MWYQLGVIFIVIAFLVYLAAAFGTSLAALLVNGVVLFLVLFRSYFEIEAGRWKYHALGVLAAFLLFVFFGNYGSPFWAITTFLVSAFAIAQVIHFLHVRKA
jgi:hypothetical protein